MSQHNFQVDLEGLIRLLSKNLYSSDAVFLRELIQNARDAWKARYLQNPDNCPVPLIDIRLWHYPEDTILEIQDNGIGLTEEEVHQFLATIGSSSKRDAVGSRDFIGQFGIGLLSCFMVATEITLLTKSAKGGPVILWKGKNDGTYTIEQQPEKELQTGSLVLLRTKRTNRSFFTEKGITNLIQKYAEFVPVPITLETENGKKQANLGHLPWENLSVDNWRTTMMGLAQQLLGAGYLDAFPIYANGRNPKIIGVGYVKTRGDQSHGKSRVYVRNMLVEEKSRLFLPRWAFFVDLIFNDDGLTLLASRETIMKDNAAIRQRKNIEKQLVQYLKNGFAKDRELRESLLQNHLMTILGLAVKDLDFFQVVHPHIPVKTNRGFIDLGQVIEQSNPLYYTISTSLLQQLNAVTNSKDILVVQGNSNSALQLINIYSRNHPEFVHKEIGTDDLMQLLGEEASLTEDEIDLLEFFDETLAEFGIGCVMQLIDNEALPAIFFPHQTTRSTRFSERWQALAKIENRKKLSRGVLCLNQKSTLIQSLVEVQQRGVSQLGPMIKLLYLNCLLTAQIQLIPLEKKILEKSLMELAAGNQAGEAEE